MNWKFWKKRPSAQKVDNRSDKEVVEQYLADPKVVNNLITNAKFLETKFRGNAFTLQQAAKKSSMSVDQISGILTLLQMKGFAYSFVKQDTQFFKISLSKEQRLVGLRESLQIVNERKAALEKEIATLTNC